MQTINIMCFPAWWKMQPQIHSASASSIAQCCCNIRLFIATHNSSFSADKCWRAIQVNQNDLLLFSIVYAFTRWTDGVTALKRRPTRHGCWTALILSPASQTALRPKPEPPFLTSVSSMSRSDHVIHWIYTSSSNVGGACMNTWRSRQIITFCSRHRPLPANRMQFNQELDLIRMIYEPPKV